MKVVIFGAAGQLGHDLVRVMSDWHLIPLNHGDVDVCDFTEVRRILTEANPQVVINTAAFHRVDDCEDQIEKAFLVNAYAPRNLAQVCADLNCVLAQMSTDYVFGGEKSSPYTEDDPPNPASVYGVSKLAGEYFVRNICPKYFIVRSSGLYGVAGSSGKGGNFVETMIRLAKEGKPIRVVNDQVLTPTFTRDLSSKLKELLQTDAYGLYHVTNSGHCSWYEFAAKIFGYLSLKPDFGSTTSVVFGAKARRPAYSVLLRSNLAALGLNDLRPWHEALEGYLLRKDYLSRSD